MRTHAWACDCVLKCGCKTPKQYPLPFPLQVELAAKKEQLESQLAHALEKSKKLAEEVKVKSKQLVDAQLAKTKDSIEIETLQKNLKLYRLIFQI